MRRTGDVFDIAQAVIYLCRAHRVISLPARCWWWTAATSNGARYGPAVKPDYFKLED